MESDASATMQEETSGSNRREVLAHSQGQAPKVNYV